MRKIVALCFALLLSFGSVAHASDWNAVMVAVHKEFSADFSAEFGKAPASGPLGVSAVLSGDEYGVTVFYSTQGKLYYYDYGCHFHGSELACHLEGKGLANAGAIGNSKYKLSDVLKMNTEALGIFQKKHGSNVKIGAVKYWEAKGNLYFVIRSLDLAKTENLMCHFHGGTSIDCHRERNAGPNQPVKP